MPARLVYLGNHDAVAVEDSVDKNNKPVTVRRKLKIGKQRTEIRIPEGTSLGDAFQAITHPDGAWRAQADSPPKWVASTDPQLAELLASHYGDVEVREVLVNGERGEFDDDGVPVGEPPKKGSKR